ncbi:MAG: hypothetical protein QOE45_1706 [Frankiaceae bacterium]|jgi:hypothetical protein|nr:hypothetical protein [Frankiaceae bacterium]
MNVRLLATVCAAGALAAAAAPANAAAPKTIKKSYALSLPVPYPATEDVPNQYGCNNGPEGQTKNTTSVTFPSAGTLVVTVDFTGDWDLYLLDSKGAMVGRSEGDSTGAPKAAQEKITYKKIKKSTKYAILACNWLGEKDATVKYTFTYAK